MITRWAMNCFRRYRRKHNIKRCAPYIKLSTRSHYIDGFYIDIRHPEPGHIYLQTGDMDVLSGSYVFESETGVIIIGDRVHIGGGTLISRSSIEIGDDVVIAWGCLIYDHNSHSIYWEKRKNDVPQEYRDMEMCGDALRNKDWRDVISAPIKICDKVWIGANCTILKGVTVGEGAVIGAGSVVTKDVEPWTVVGGNPARYIKSIEH